MIKDERGDFMGSCNLSLTEVSMRKISVEMENWKENQFFNLNSSSVSIPIDSIDFLFLTHFDVICDLLLNRRTATWNLFVNLMPGFHEINDMNKK